MSRPQQYRLEYPLLAEQVEHIDTMFETLFRAVRELTGPPPLAGLKVYWVADSSGGAVTRKLTFRDGVLVSET